MLVLEEFDSSTLILTLSGRFDQRNDMDLETALLRGDEKRVRHVIFNLEQISTIDTAGIGRIYVTFFRLKEKGVCLSLVNPKPSVREIFDLVEIPKVMRVFESDEAARVWHASVFTLSSPSAVSSPDWQAVQEPELPEPQKWAHKSPTEASA
ncbi:MAG: STAS domain-containing protein [Nitrospirae bacterium]|nr:STAS domain-containing protein [Nitrospirota bacterium]MDA1304004.1 STAS domain-containing protein [Nitrospirota bacterium]